MGMADGAISGKVNRKGYHDGAIFALTVKEGRVYSSGSKDRTLKVADLSL